MIRKKMNNADKATTVMRLYHNLILLLYFLFERILIKNRTNKTKSSKRVLEPKQAIRNKIMLKWIQNSRLR
jgi:hypothetical protein